MATSARVRSGIEGRGGGAARRLLFGALASGAAAAVAVGVVVVVVADGGAGEPASVRSAATTDPTTDATTETTTGTTTAPAEPRPANGAAPGRAVAVGGVLHTYDGSGQETGTTDLAPLVDVGAVSSDLAGGWVACGSDPDEENPYTDVNGSWPAGEPRHYPNVPRLVWFPQGRAPVVLDTAIEPGCLPGAVQVVDSPAGPTAVYRSRGYSEAEMQVIEPDVAANIGWHAIVLATGADERLPFPQPTGPAWAARPPWAAATGHLLVQDVGGYHLYDLASHEALPTPPIEVTPIAFRLSPDGTSVAALTPASEEAVDLTVYDLASGARRSQHRIEAAGPIAQLSYDGTVAAVASSTDAEAGRVTVVDLASGTRHTLDAYGAIP